MIKIQNGPDTTFLISTESVVIAIWNVLTSDQQRQVAEGVAGDMITDDPNQLVLTLDGVLMEITKSLAPELRERVVDGLMAIREQQPVPMLVVRRAVLSPGEFPTLKRQWLDMPGDPPKKR